jgi:hypothetical protein
MEQATYGINPDPKLTHLWTGQCREITGYPAIPGTRLAAISFNPTSTLVISQLIPFSFSTTVVG